MQGITAIISYGWNLYLRGWKALSRLGLLFWVFNIVAGFVGYMVMYLLALATDNKHEAIEFVFPAFDHIRAAMGGFGFFVLTIIALVLMIFVSLWLTIASLRTIRMIDDGATPRVQLLDNTHLVLPFLWVNFMMGIAAAVGFILLIVPGILFTVWFEFAPYILVFENVRGVAALKASRRLVRGRFWAVFGRLVGVTLTILVVSLIMNYAANLFTAFTTAPLMERAGNGQLSAVIWGLLVNSAATSLPLILVAPLSGCLSYALYRAVSTRKQATADTQTSRVRPEDLLPKRP